MKRGDWRKPGRRPKGFNGWVRGSVCVGVRSVTGEFGGVPGGQSGDVVERRRAVPVGKREPPIIGLAPYGREWVPALVLTRSRERREFLILAEWLCREFRAEVVERYGGEGEEDKEYWTLRVDGSDWLLMRCYYPIGVSLNGGSMGDLPAFEAIGRAVHAAPVGWRYRWLRFRRRFRGGGRD